MDWPRSHRRPSSLQDDEPIGDGSASELLAAGALRGRKDLKSPPGPQQVTLVRQRVVEEDGAPVVRVATSCEQASDDCEKLRKCLMRGLAFARVRRDGARFHDPYPGVSMISIPSLLMTLAVASTPAPDLVSDATCPAPARQVPLHPISTMRNKISGTALVKARIDGCGRVIEPRVVDSSGHAVLDQAALDTVLLWVLNEDERRQVGDGWVNLPVRFGGVRIDARFISRTRNPSGSRRSRPTTTPIRGAVSPC